MFHRKPVSGSPVFDLDKSKPVIVLEDDPFTASGIETMLNDLGFADVDVCLSYAEAAAKVGRVDFGLAICDINVGGMMSFGLISKIIAEGCPVVTVSGYVTEPDPQERRVFLAKPVEEDGLRLAIEKASALMVTKA